MIAHAPRDFDARREGLGRSWLSALPIGIFPIGALPMTGCGGGGWGLAGRRPQLR
jgi:hypothetical protein